MIRTIQKFNEERTFGIEIEFTGVEREVVARILSSKGVACQVEGYSHTTRSHWKFITDASCGYELVSPILKGRDGLAQLELACEALNEAGAKVNKNCGLHVHHNVNDYGVNQIKNIFALSIKLEKTIDTFVPASRRNNQYCKSPTRGYTPQLMLDRIKEVNSINELNNIYRDRYLKVNFQSYLKYGTIEFRQHSGTTDYNKMYNWILFTQQIVEKAAGIVSYKYEAERDNLESLRNTLRLIPAKGATYEIHEMFQYLRERAKDLAA